MSPTKELLRQVHHRDAPRQLLEQHAELEAGKVRAEAEVLAFAEPDVLVGLPVDDELIARVAEHILQRMSARA